MYIRPTDSEWTTNIYINDGEPANETTLNRTTDALREETWQYWKILVGYDVSSNPYDDQNIKLVVNPGDTIIDNDLQVPSLSYFNAATIDCGQWT